MHVTTIHDAKYDDASSFDAASRNGDASSTSARHGDT